MISKDGVIKQIEKGYADGAKTFSFDEAHDPAKPVMTWFQQSAEGLTFFAIFYTQACRWLRCTGCNLPSVSSRFPVNYKNVVKQIDRVFSDEEVRKNREDIRRVIVSNNGSVLDQVTFPSTALMHLVLQTQLYFPNLSVLSLETRAEYVETEELEFLARLIKEGETPTDLELAIGFEAFDDAIRNGEIKKGLSKKIFEKLVQDMARHRFRLKCYLMQKPVAGMSGEEAVKDVHNAFAYFAEVSRRHTDKDGKPLVSVNVHLNPTYAARGTVLEKAFLSGTYAPPTLRDVARAALGAEGLPLTVFIGLNDEGLAVDGGSFIRAGDGPVIEKLEAFNRTQDYGILRSTL